MLGGTCKDGKSLTLVGRLDGSRAEVHGRFMAMLEMTLICEYVLLDKDGVSGL